MKVGSWPRVGRTALAHLIVLSASMQAAAQAPSPAKPGSDTTGLERAQKQADAVFHWIKLHGDKSAERAAKPAPAPAPPPKRVAAPTATATVASPAPGPGPSTAPAAAAATPTASASTAVSQPATAALADAGAAQQPANAAINAPTAAPAAAPVEVASINPSTVQAVSTPAPAPAPEAEDDSPLKLISRVEPAFPRQLQQTLRGGVAQVRFTIEPNGTVSQASAIKATHSRLGVAAVDAIKQWRFEPIKRAREVAIEIAFNNE